MHSFIWEKNLCPYLPIFQILDCKILTLGITNNYRVCKGIIIISEERPAGQVFYIHAAHFPKWYLKARECTLSPEAHVLVEYWRNRDEDSGYLCIGCRRILKQNADNQWALQPTNHALFLHELGCTGSICTCFSPHLVNWRIFSMCNNDIQNAYIY